MCVAVPWGTTGHIVTVTSRMSLSNWPREPHGCGLPHPSGGRICWVCVSDVNLGSTREMVQLRIPGGSGQGWDHLQLEQALPGDGLVGGLDPPLCPSRHAMWRRGSLPAPLHFLASDLGCVREPS